MGRMGGLADRRPPLGIGAYHAEPSFRDAENPAQSLSLSHPSKTALESGAAKIPLLLRTPRFL